MTDQERPVEERNELLDDRLAATNVAVEELEESEQGSAAADQQPESAEQPAAPAAETVPTAMTDEGVSAPVAEAAPADEPAALVPQAADRLSAARAEEASATPTAEGSGAPAPTATAEEASAAPAAEAAPADSAPAAEAEGASYTPVAEAAPADSAPAAEAEGASYTPAAEAAPADSAPAAEAEGASYTPVAEEESGRPRRVKDLEPGMELEGRVTSIALYGIFVDIGVGRDGLVHISEMSDTRIDSPSDIVQIGDTVKVRIKSVEPDGRRISLTMRSKERGDRRGRKKPEFDREQLAALRVGDNIKGTVTGIAPFGVFVDIGVGKDGLVHVSELTEGRIERAEDAVQVGQTYTFKILEVDAEGTRISLSLRRAQRSQRLQQIEKGQILEGKVSGLAPFGAFVDIGVGRDGLVHISELSDERVEKVENAVKVGDVVQVRVLDVDSQSKRISLSMRMEDRPREAPPGDVAAEARSERGQREERGRRDDRPPRDDRGPRRPRQEVAPAPLPPEVSPAGDEQEEFQGDATLEDLLSKFSGGKRERRRRQEEEEEGDEDRYTRRQREAHRRTLQQLSDDE